MNCDGGNSFDVSFRMTQLRRLRLLRPLLLLLRLPRLLVQTDSGEQSPCRAEGSGDDSTETEADLQEDPLEERRAAKGVSEAGRSTFGDADNTATEKRSSSRAGPAGQALALETVLPAKLSRTKPPEPMDEGADVDAIEEARGSGEDKLERTSLPALRKEGNFKSGPSNPAENGTDGWPTGPKTKAVGAAITDWAYGTMGVAGAPSAAMAEEPRPAICSCSKPEKSDVDTITSGCPARLAAARGSGCSASQALQSWEACNCRWVLSRDVLGAGAR